MAKISVLYLSYDGMTDPLGQSQVLPYLRGLINEGYDIHLISFEKEERYSTHKKTISSWCEAYGINWYPQNYTKTPPLISTLKDVRTMRRIALQLHKKYDIKLVHCRSYIAALVGLKLQRSKGLKFVFDMRGFWADERVEGNIWNLNNFIFKQAYRYFKRKEFKFFQKADHVVSLTESGKQEILSWESLALNSSKITVIPCCVDTALFDPKKINPHQLRELKKALGILSSDQILGYVGSIGTWYMLDEMLLFFKYQYEKNSSMKFLFVTGEPSQLILSKAQELGIPSSAIIMTSTVHKYVPLHIALFDKAIFFIRPTFSKKASSPTKQGEIMAMGVPIICNAGVGDTDAIIEEFNAGWVIPSVDREDDLSIDLSSKEFDSDQIRNGALTYFSLAEGVKRYAKIYSDLT